MWFDLPTPADGHRLVHINGRICLQCHAYVYGGSQVPESWRSPSGRGVEVEVAEVDAPEQKKVHLSLLCNSQVNSSFSSCALVCHFGTSLR